MAAHACDASAQRLRQEGHVFKLGYRTKLCLSKIIYRSSACIYYTCLYTSHLCVPYMYIYILYMCVFTTVACYGHGVLGFKYFHNSFNSHKIALKYKLLQVASDEETGVQTVKQCAHVNKLLSKDLKQTEYTARLCY